MPATSTLPKLVDEPVAGASPRPAANCPSAVAVNVTDPPGDAVTVSVPVREFMPDGRNATPIMQLPPPAMGPVQLFEVTRTSTVLLLVSIGWPVMTSPLLKMVQLAVPVVLPMTTVP